MIFFALWFYNDVTYFWHFSKTFSFVLQFLTSINLTHGLISLGNKFNNLMHSNESLQYCAHAVQL